MRGNRYFSILEMREYRNQNANQGMEHCASDSENIALYSLAGCKEDQVPRG